MVLQQWREFQPKQKKHVHAYSNLLEELSIFYFQNVLFYKKITKMQASLILSFWEYWLYVLII